MPLSPRQQRVFMFIRGYISANQEAPTIAEIGEHFQYRSPATVHRILSILEREGLISRTRYLHRGLEVCEAQRAA